MHQKLNLALDRNKLEKLRQKEYRDAYLRAQVHNWVAYQFQSLRKKLRLTQSEMSKRVEKPQSVVSRLESEDYRGVSVQTLLDFACAMDVALVVQFVSYPEFLARTRDKTEIAMQPDTLFESLARQERARFAFGSNLSTFSQMSRSTKDDSLFDANERRAMQTGWAQPVYPSRVFEESLTGMPS